jgi:DNA-binding protein WhiA
MSFSADVKNEIAQIMPERRCCMLAQIAGFVRTCGAVSLSGKGAGLKLTTENAAAARSFIKLLKQYFHIEEELALTWRKNMKNQNLYEVAVLPQMGAEQILREIGILRVKEGLNYLDQQIPEDIVKNRCCKKAALRGLFSGAGSISDPEKGYHMEIVTASPELAENIRRLMHSFEIGAKTVSRRKSTLVYIKESEQIVDFFNIIGAHGKLLELENIRIKKEMRNKANRVVNCETANLDKVVDASSRQIAAIETIMAGKGLQVLPDTLRQAALARLENPEASLAELADIMGGQMSKSGLNHQLRKIETLASKM